MANLPNAEHFYDLFAGGCAVSHAAYLSGKYKYIHANDVDWRPITLFSAAVEGKYQDEDRWISRDDFERLKETDPYVAICWSFGNNMRDNLYGRDKEAYKKAMHEAVFGDERAIQDIYPGISIEGTSPHERRLSLRKAISKLKETKNDSVVGVASGESLSRVQHLERMDGVANCESCVQARHLCAQERVESLERYDAVRLGSPDIIVTTTILDYRDVKIAPDSVIYCDIPYKDTDKYAHPFSHEDFYEWALKQKNIYISSYEMPAPFVCVAETAKRSILSATANNLVTERLYTLQETVGSE